MICLFHPAHKIIRLAAMILVTSRLSLCCKLLRHDPLLKFHTLMLPSLAPVISRLPDRSNVMAVIAALPCACENCIAFSPVSTSHTVITDPWQPLTTCVCYTLPETTVPTNILRHCQCLNKIDFDHMFMKFV